MPVQTVASLHVGLDKREAETPTETSTFLSSVAELAIFVLGFIAALIGLLVLPGVLRNFDSLLTVPLEGDGSGAPVAREADPSGGFDMPNFAQSELSAADIPKQTEVLRALKDALDAELESVRAAIRRERAQAKAKDTP